MNERPLRYAQTGPDPAHETCQRPPEGWWCTREPFHGGPCAAYPLGEGPIAADTTGADAAAVAAGVAGMNELASALLLGIGVLQASTNPQIQRIGNSLNDARPLLAALVELGRYNPEWLVELVRKHTVR